MSKALETFNCAISDSELLLQHYATLNSQGTDVLQLEVLKRATLIMTLTAWETYVEDRCKEEVASRMTALKGSQIANYVQKNLDETLRKFNTPNSQNTKHLYKDFVGVDVTEFWVWPGMEIADDARAKLNLWIKKRGDAVHRSIIDKQAQHLVKLEDLKKCLNFFKKLVEVTDTGLEKYQ